MRPRLAFALCLVLAGCAVTTKAPLRVTGDANAQGLPWAIGGVYDTLNGRLTITANDAAVADGSFGLLADELQLTGAYQGYAITARCRRARDTSVHFGTTSVECEVSVADSTAAAPVRSVRLGPQVDRNAVAAILDSPSSSTSIAVYDPSTGQVTITIDGTIVAEGTFPATAAEFELRGQHRDHNLTALCIREQAAGMGHGSVRCTVTEDEPLAQGTASSAAGDVSAPAIAQPVTTQLAPAQAAAAQPATVQLAPEQPAAVQPAIAQLGSAQAAAAQPVASPPVAAQTSGAQPVTSPPVAAQTPEAQPVTSPPVPAQTSGAQPATARPAATEPARTQIAAAQPKPLRPCSGPQCIHIEPQTYHLASSPDMAWVIAGDYDSLSSRLTLTVNGAPVAQGRFGFFDTELQIANEYEGHSISASCTKSHGGSLPSSSLKCTVFVDREPAVVLKRDT